MPSAKEQLRDLVSPNASYVVLREAIQRVTVKLSRTEIANALEIAARQLEPNLPPIVRGRSIVEHSPDGLSGCELVFEEPLKKELEK